MWRIEKNQLDRRHSTLLEMPLHSLFDKTVLSAAVMKINAWKLPSIIFIMLIMWWHILFTHQFCTLNFLMMKIFCELSSDSQTCQSWWLWSQRTKYHLLMRKTCISALFIFPVGMRYFTMTNNNKNMLVVFVIYD